MYLQQRDLGQAQVLLSQTIASLTQFKCNYEGIKLKAYLRLAEVKLLSDETPEAFTMLNQSLLPRILEQDNASLLCKTLILLAKTCIKMA